jgi:hypothetical protein
MELVVWLVGLVGFGQVGLVGWLGQVRLGWLVGQLGGRVRLGWLVR